MLWLSPAIRVEQKLRPCPEIRRLSGTVSAGPHPRRDGDFECAFLLKEKP